MQIAVRRAQLAIALWAFSPHARATERRAQRACDRRASCRFYTKGAWPPKAFRADCLRIQYAQRFESVGRELRGRARSACR
jgi:hypothetical protein